MDAEDPLAKLAEAVADGHAVEWQSAGSTMSGEELDTLAELRIIEAIARLHRANSDATSDAQTLTPPDSGCGPVLFEWGTLRVIERVGAGSFGEVFRAWDTTLDRQVALKLLSRVPAERPRTAALVVREGQMLARIRHPNVMIVHGAQEIDGRVGIWGEFLHGRTLAQIVAANGPFSAQEASAYGESVCRALTAVHRVGLLHRDVKAQNVMRESGGRIVLMDFGLGREATKATLKTSALELAGTPPYLAPELFLGEPASPQSDVYSVGVLLFFLVAGTFPVEGRSLTEIASEHAAGKRRRLQDLCSDLQPTFVDVVDRALSPDKGSRYLTAGALEAALARTDRVPVRPPSFASRAWASTTALLILVVAALAWALMRQHAADTPPVPVSFSLTPPAGSRFAIGTRNVAVVSPDGRRVAFVAGPGQGSLWWRSLDDQKDTMIPDSRGAVAPFWSPDSESIAFFTQGGLQLASISGAKSEIKTELWEQRGASWGSHGDILLARSRRDAIYRLDQNRTLTPVTTVDRPAGEVGHLWPQFLPDGNCFIFYVSSTREEIRGIYLGALDGRKPRKLVATDASGVFGSGFLLFIRRGSLYAQLLDVDAGALRGAPRKIAAQVDATWDGRGTMSVSQTGVLSYAPIKDNPRLVSIDMDGGQNPTVIADPDKFRNPAISRDGRWLVLQKYEDSISHLWRVDLQSNSSTGLRYLTGNPECPVAGPDGQIVYSASSVEGWQDLYISTADRSTTPRPLVVDDKHDKLATDWSSDGRYVVYMSIGPTGDYDLWISTVPNGSGDTHQWPVLNRAGVFEANAKFSPNGRWLAFTANENDQQRLEVYVAPLSPDERIDGKSVQVSEGGGYDPSWREGNELVYLDARGALMERRVQDGPTLAAPRHLLDTSITTPSATRNNYVLRPFDRRAIFLMPVPELEETPFRIVLNWTHLAQLAGS